MRHLVHSWPVWPFGELVRCREHRLTRWRLALGLAAAALAGCGSRAPGLDCVVDACSDGTPDSRLEDIGAEYDGWDAPPGSGLVFIVNQIAFAGAGTGFDLDGQCAGGCIDNALAPLGRLVNDQVRQALLGGGRLLLIEIAGLVRPYTGWDRAVTVKVYRALDGDVPSFRANNFKVPSGHDDCCKFAIEAGSLNGGQAQARTRIRARIEDHRLRTVPFGDASLFLELSKYLRLSLAGGRLSLVLPDRLDELTSGLLGGAVLVASLAELEDSTCRLNPLGCSGSSSDTTMLDVVGSFVGQPDIDVDGDGHECVADRDGDGRYDLCCDGIAPAPCRPGPSCEEIGDPNGSRCAVDARVADGYSAAFVFSAVQAGIVGVRAVTSTIP